MTVRAQNLNNLIRRGLGVRSYEGSTNFLPPAPSSTTGRIGTSISNTGPRFPYGTLFPDVLPHVEQDGIDRLRAANNGVSRTPPSCSSRT